MTQFQLDVNGKKMPVASDGNTPLLTVLRDQLRFTGAKAGCGEGQCGACTVLLEGQAVHSCITAVREVGSRRIDTIEGLAKEGKLHPVQEAFLDQAAFQCGFCTSGMVMATVALLKKNPDPSAREITSALNGNVCRCGTYPRIVKAVQQAAKTVRNA